MAGGRPSKFKGTCDLFIAEIEAGQPMAAAAVSAGVALSTVKGWLTSGREGSSDQFSLFLARYTRARAIGLKNTVTEIRDKGADDWRAVAWLGERLYPEVLSLKQAALSVNVNASANANPTPPAPLTHEEMRKRLIDATEYTAKFLAEHGNGERPFDGNGR
jgi:hypothetical protein